MNPLTVNDARARLTEALALHPAIADIDGTLGDDTIGFDYLDPDGTIRYCEIDIRPIEVDA